MIRSCGSFALLRFRLLLRIQREIRNMNMKFGPLSQRSKKRSKRNFTVFHTGRAREKGRERERERERERVNVCVCVCVCVCEWISERKRKKMCYSAFIREITPPLLSFFPPYLTSRMTLAAISKATSLRAKLCRHRWNHSRASGKERREKNRKGFI